MTREERIAFGKDWKIKNREHVRAYHSEYVKQNRKRINKSQQKYNKKTQFYSSFKGQCKYRGVVFTLTLEEYLTIRKNKCTYCKGKLPAMGGLDRIDLARGYELDNVLPCCTACNVIKNQYLTVEEMRVAMKAVLALRSKYKKPKVKDPFGDGF